MKAVTQNKRKKETEKVNDHTMQSNRTKREYDTDAKDAKGKEEVTLSIEGHD